MKKIIQKLLRKAGMQLKRYPDYYGFPAFYIARRMQLIRDQNIDTLFDIGANVGQYGVQMRELGYNKSIISFEPLQRAFTELEKVSAKDPNWMINNYALGNSNTKSVINVSDNSVSSSILDMLPQHLDSAPESRYIAKEEIEIKTLDSVFNSFCSEISNVMIKIDTQGYEKTVLDGAEESLKRIKIIQLEMSLVSLYENEMLMVDMIRHLDSKGFQLFSLEEGHSDPVTNQLLQVDGVFVNRIFENKK